MASDFNKPVQSDGFLAVLDTIRDNQDANAVMFNGVSVSNIPVNAVRFNNGSFSLWDGAAWNVSAVSIAGGGTGATTAAGARTNLDVLSSSELSSQYLRKDGNLSGLTDKSLAFNTVKQPATTSSTGVVEKAESSEMSSGTDDKFPDCATIKGYYGDVVNTIVDMTGVSSFTSGQIHFSKIGRIVTVSCGGLFHSSSSSITAFNVIPEGFQPHAQLGTLKSIRIPCQTDSGGLTIIRIVTGASDFGVEYRSWSGSAVSNTTTDGFTFSYVTD